MASKRELLRQAAAKNDSSRGTEPVIAPEEEVKKEPEKEVKPSEETKAKTVEVKKPEVVETPVKSTVSAMVQPAVENVVSSKNTKTTSSTNYTKKYTGAKKSFSIMLDPEDNTYLLKKSAKMGIPIQDLFCQIMADEIEAVKAGNGDESLAEEYMRLHSGNQRRNVLAPEDLIVEIKVASAEIMLKQGKFIAYAVHRAKLNDKEMK